jgi:hypothetical protein
MLTINFDRKSYPANFLNVACLDVIRDAPPMAYCAFMDWQMKLLRMGRANQNIYWNLAPPFVVDLQGGQENPSSP